QGSILMWLQQFRALIPFVSGKSAPSRRSKAFAATKSHRRKRSSRLQVEALEHRLVPALYRVTGASDLIAPVDLNHAGTTADSFLAVSLRSALQAANVSPGADTITFDATVFSSNQTIAMSNGQFELSDNVPIVGPAAGVTLNGQFASRVLSVDTGVSASLSNLAIVDGLADGANGGG